MSRDDDNSGNRTARLRAIGDKARPIMTSVRTIAIGSALAAGWLSVLFYIWFRPDSWGWLPLGVFLAVLLSPFLVLTAFLFGLRRIVQLPQRIQKLGATGTESAAAAYRAVRPASDMPDRKRRGWRLFRALRDLQSAVLDSKGTLIGYFTMAKFINPLAMGVVVMALGAAIAVIGLAGLATAITFFAQIL